VKALNLRNRDRVLLTGVLDRIFQEGVCDMRTCLEKKKQWKGLLHHLHYKPVNDAAARFLDAVRNNEARSVYSEFERAVGEKRIRDAVDVLRGEKGTGAVLRNLDYLLSRCETGDDLNYVLDAIATDNKILLIQLLLHYGRETVGSPRLFRFLKFGMMRVHEETEAEMRTRRSAIDAAIASCVRSRLASELERACRGTLGKV
jgi:hypothetical protein